MYKRGLFATLALVAVMSLVAAACGDDDSDSVPDQPTTDETEPVEATETEPVEAPETEPVEAPETEPVEAPETEPVEAPETEPVSAPDDAAPAPAEPIKIRWNAIVGASQSYLPIVLTEQGIAERHGFEIEIIQQSGAGAQFIALRSGDTDLVTGNILDLHIQRSQDLDVSSIGSFLKFESPIIALPGGPQTAADLEGSKFGTPRASLFGFLIMRAATVNSFGFDLAEDTELAEGAPGLLNELIRSGELDAAFQFSSLAFGPLQRGDFVLVTSAQDLIADAGFNPDFLYLLYIVSQDWIDANPGAVDRLMAMIAEGREVLQTDDSVWPALAESSGVDPEFVPAFMEFTRAELDTAYTPELVEATQEIFTALVDTVGSEVLGDITTVDPEAFIFPSG